MNKRYPILARMALAGAVLLAALTQMAGAAGAADAADDAGAAVAAGQPRLERWRSYAGVSWEAAREGGAPAAYAGSVKAPIAGIHFDGDGRAFVSTPRLLAADLPATLSILDTSADGGPARLAAYPSAALNDPKGAPATHLRNVLGFHVDRRNGWLWALDQGYVAGEAEAPPGAQKILVIELGTGKVLKSLALDGVADRKGSFLNDIAVDEARRIAYVSDSGLRSAPHNRAGIIVADYASGRARRLLDRHASVMPEPGVAVVANGAPVWPGNPLVLGINGIALSPDAATLYWTTTTGTRLHAVSSALLRDPAAPPSRIAAAVRVLGTVGGNSDGIVADGAGRVYITDVSRGGIVRYDPRGGTLALLAADEGVRWPDTAAFGPDGSLVFTASALNRHFAGQVVAGTEKYELWRLALD